MVISQNNGSLEAARERLEASLLKLSGRLQIREDSRAEKASQQSERIATLEQALYRIEAEKNKLIKNLEDQAHEDKLVSLQEKLNEANTRIKELEARNRSLNKECDDLQAKIQTHTLPAHHFSSDSASGDFDHHLKKLEAERNDIRKVLDASIITIDAVINRKDA